MTETTEDLTPSELAGCPDHDSLYAAFFRLLPYGRAWGTQDFSFDRDTRIKQFISGIALYWTAYEQAMCDALNEWFCESSITDIDLWRLDYGIPDECDTSDVCSKVQTAGRALTAEELVNILTANGYAASGRWLTGNDPEYPGVRSTFRVMLTAATGIHSRVTMLPYPLGSAYSIGLFEQEQTKMMERAHCILERYIPAHCAIDAQFAGMWHPSMLGAKIVSWFNADAPPADGPVASWDDGHGLTLVQTDPTKQPVAGMVGGCRCVTFDGVDDFLRAESVGALPSGTAPSVVNMLVIQNDAAGPADDAIFGYGSAADQIRQIQAAYPGGTPRFSIVNIAASGRLTDTDKEFVGLHQVVAKYDGAELHGRIDGAPTVPPLLTIAGTLATGTARTTMGASNADTPANHASVSVRNCIGTTPLTTDEQLKLEAWLLWEVGQQVLLPGDHPYYSMRP
jgi:hypothetical protein